VTEENRLLGSIVHQLYTRSSQTVGRPPPRGAQLVLWAGGVVSMRDIFILNEIWVQDTEMKQRIILANRTNYGLKKELSSRHLGRQTI
jgi:hypothetical protein